MDEQKKKMFLIKLPYWIGIGADALWFIGLMFPSVYGALSGNPDFAPDFETRQIMGIACSLMAGWTCLLIWAVKEPIRRRFVGLLTAIPVLSGMTAVTVSGFFVGSPSPSWILIKSTILLALMINSYRLAGKMESENK